MAMIKAVRVISAILLFIGAIIVVGDSIPPIRDYVDRSEFWNNVYAGLDNLEVLEIDTDQQIAVLNKEDIGFNELLQIIDSYRPQYSDKQVEGITRQVIMSYGELEWNSINIGYISQDSFQVEQVTFWSSLQDWVKEYRQQEYVITGAYFLLFGFLLQLISLLFSYKTISKKITSQYRYVILFSTLFVFAVVIVPGLEIGNRFIILLTAALVVATAYYAYLVSQQKKYSIRPVIALRSMVFHLNSRDFPKQYHSQQGTLLTERMLGNFISVGPELKGSVVASDGKVTYYKLYMVNIGVGPAINIDRAIFL